LSSYVKTFIALPFWNLYIYDYIATCCW